MPKKVFRPRQKTIAQLNMAKTCMSDAFYLRKIFYAP